jgi:hypothetical protein
MSRLLLYRSFELLEPYAGKLARTVLRGESSRKGADLLDIGLGGVQSAVYATEVSLSEYVTYTTEETEKLELARLTEKLGGNIEMAIKQLAESKQESSTY